MLRKSIQIETKSIKNCLCSPVRIGLLVSGTARCRGSESEEELVQRETTDYTNKSTSVLSTSEKTNKYVLR